jgi:hypothetical protein
VPQEKITIGIENYKEENEVTLSKMLIAPFNTQNYELRISNYEVEQKRIRNS